MKLVYYTHLLKDKSTGLNYSIPTQICEQSKIDDVFWYNYIDSNSTDWENIDIYHNKNDIKSGSIKEFPTPFNRPDLVIFESFYHIKDCIEAKWLKRNKIPYIIIPRGALTKGAQDKKKIKKIIGNILMFYKFAKNAAAIQFLTEREKLDSGDKWNKNYLVISNGVYKKKITKEWNSTNQIKGVYIGRIDYYHKGLDLLINACKNNYHLLLNNNCTIDIYGPKSKDSSFIQNLIIKESLDKIINLKNGIFDEEKEKVLLDSDFFILTSRFEGHPMGLLEALSYGLPCLVTEGTNMANDILLADAGWVASTNIDSLSNALRKCIEEKNLYSKKGYNALQLSNKFNWDVLAIQSHDQYQTLIKKF